MARKISYIVVHESDTPNGRPHTAKDIDQWHRERGFSRSESARKAFNPTLKAIGYQYVICVDGTLQTGRAESEVPAAVQGYNSVSINICMIGKGKYTPAQWRTLKALVGDLCKRYPGAAVKGHYQFDTAHGKTCPDFQVDKWFAAGMEPPNGHVLEVTA